MRPSRTVLFVLLAQLGTSLATRRQLQAAAQPVSAEERKAYKPCSFATEENGKPASCSVEAPEQAMVRAYVDETSTVLELGGRYGTTTCEIAAVQRNSGHLVTVAPTSITLLT